MKAPNQRSNARISAISSLQVTRSYRSLLSIKPQTYSAISDIFIFGMQDRRLAVLEEIEMTFAYTEANAQAKVKDMLLKAGLCLRFEDAEIMSSKLAAQFVSALWQLQFGSEPSVQFKVFCFSFKSETIQRLHFLDGDAQTTNFLLKLLGKVFPTLACSHHKVRSDKIGNGESLYTLHRFYWKYLDFRSDDNAKLDIRIDHHVHFEHALTGAAYSIFYTFTITANQGWRADRANDRRYVEEKMNLAFAMGRHPRLGADSTCAVTLMNSDMMRIIASFVIIR